jgi:hypothetical protein
LYLRVTRDAHYNEVSTERAVEIQQILSDKHLLAQLAAEAEEELPIVPSQKEGSQSKFSTADGDVRATLSVPTSVLPQQWDVSVIKTGTIAMHELYLSFVDAGFTEDQALKLIGNIVRPNT